MRFKVLLPLLKDPFMILRTLLLAFLPSFSALAAPPHVHGVALLDVVVDGATLSLHLDAPLDNLAGFEHPAYNPSQKRTLDQMVTQLNRPQELFLPTAAAACRADKPILVSAALQAPAHQAAHAHADMDADFAFHCAHPEKLHGLEVRLISAFPRIHKVKVQIAGPNGQSSAQLEAAATRVDF